MDPQPLLGYLEREPPKQCHHPRRSDMPSETAPPIPAVIFFAFLAVLCSAFSLSSPSPSSRVHPPHSFSLCRHPQCARSRDEQLVDLLHTHLRCRCLKIPLRTTTMCDGILVVLATPPHVTELIVAHSVVGGHIMKLVDVLTDGEEAGSRRRLMLDRRPRGGFRPQRAVSRQEERGKTVLDLLSHLWLVLQDVTDQRAHLVERRLRQGLDCCRVRHSPHTCQRQKGVSTAATR